MLFNSPEFIYFFLPFSVALWWYFQRLQQEQAAQWFIVVCSVYFYGWWDTRYVPLLMGNAIGNFYLGKQIAKTRSRSLLIVGLAYNVGLLGYYKYADFFIGNINAATDHHVALLHVALPLGISFFTFQVIAWLADCHKGLVADFNLRRFAFSVSFFPHLIAGPILHYADVMPQLQKRIVFDAKQFSQGLFLFVIGLFKKSVIADFIAEKVDVLFASNIPLQLIEAWVSAIGYGLQIYFDFSGYSDMAIGIGLMVGIALPLNFNSPYQATSIADFWRRWHKTLSRFLRDYLYIPLGGNRKGFSRGLLAAAVTMVIGGLWHGAAWTYVWWGVMHGAFIGIHRIWTQTGVHLPKSVAWACTFLSVTAAWVVFRSESVAQALSIWEGMAGLNGFSVPLIAADSCQNCITTTLITGIEIIQYIVLLTVCLESMNAQQMSEKLQPNLKNFAYLITLFFTSIWMAGTHESFIYWQF